MMVETAKIILIGLAAFAVGAVCFEVSMLLIGEQPLFPLG